jgi:hypothetical protein
MGASWRRTLVMGISTLVVVATELAERTHTAQPEAPPALVKLREYLVAYEARLTELIAEERFEQRQELDGRRRRNRQVLVSEIGFLRLPGSQVWLGQRRVQRIDGRTLSPRGPTLGDLFTAAGNDVFVRAKAIADENARHNFGAARSVNVPTLPLDLLDHRNATAFEVEPGPTRVLRGQRVQLLTLRERPPGRLVGFEDVRYVRTDVRASVVPESGVLVEAEVDLYPPVPLRFVRQTIRVAFAHDATLDIFVPTALEERAPRFSGRATYSKFKRFRTSARVLP